MYRCELQGTQATGKDLGGLQTLLAAEAFFLPPSKMLHVDPKIQSRCSAGDGRCSVSSADKMQRRTWPWGELREDGVRALEAHPWTLQPGRTGWRGQGTEASRVTSVSAGPARVSCR